MKLSECKIVRGAEFCSSGSKDEKYEVPVTQDLNVRSSDISSVESYDADASTSAAGVSGSSSL